MKIIRMPSFIKKLEPIEAYTHGYEEGYRQAKLEIKEETEKPIPHFKFMGANE